MAIAYLKARFACRAALHFVAWLGCFEYRLECFSLPPYLHVLLKGRPQFLGKLCAFACQVIRLRLLVGMLVLRHDGLLCGEVNTLANCVNRARGVKGGC